MELSNLNGGGVLQVNDVTVAREAFRQRRYRRLVLVLGVIAVVVVGRTLWASMRYAQGHYRAAASDFSWPLPHLPSGVGTYAPAGVLTLVLLLAVAGPLLGAGRSPHVMYRPEDIDTRLADVVGAGPVVEEVTKSLNLFLAHATFRQGMGGTPRRAVLFEGPPGTGKTYLAKAMAGEANVPFLFVSSSAFQSMYYGQTNRKIRSYFRALRAHARREGGAIGFIEEIDAIGASRAGLGSGGGREGVAGVVNELLIQLQSFDQPTGWSRVGGWFVEGINRWLPASGRLRRPRPAAANVLVIGATNRADDLDPALLRPGRFDRTINVGLPNRAGRRQIIDYYLARKAHDSGLDDPARREELAGATLGYSPVMLEHLFDEALVWALRRGADRLSWEDVGRAKLTEELGLAQPVVYTDAERAMIATHESGHATVAHFLAPERRLEVLSVIKRRDALGLLAHSEREERWLKTRAEVEAAIRIAMGGLVAEDLFFSQTSTGVAGDLQAATRMAAQMVGSFGMAGSLISLDAANPAGGADIVAKALSDDSARAAVERILNGARSDVEELLTANRDVVAALRDALLERDELLDDQITAVIDAALRTRRVVDLRDPEAPAPLVLDVEG